MRSRRFIWIVLCLLCVAGAWLFWRETGQRAAGKKAAATASVAPGSLRSVTPLTNPALVSAAAAKTNRLAYRLSNTTRTIGQLMNDRCAILLENALIDSSRPVNFSIPSHLRSQGDPGAYVVQSRGPINAAFRALLARAGAEIISYIPNDAYLVRITAGGANGLAAQPPVQSVIPYEPYYKIQSSLLGLAVNQNSLPDGAVLNLGLFAANAPQTIQEIEKLGGRVLAQDRSPFGPLLRVQPPANWTALATLPGVQIVEPYHPRVHANDLSRVNTGVSTDTLVPTNYMNLTGLNVIVQVNDSGIDATHPDFSAGRVLGLAAADLVDTNGHGTFVAGEIAGNGSKSLSPVDVGGVLGSMNFGSVTNADFRGKAPQATLFSMSWGQSDYAMQTNAATVGALISNNSWNNDGDNTYSLASASYDAATRDALPEVTGSQPVLFVFSAGNAGNGDNSFDPGGGDRDSIQSPATAKNVITVGAIQESRSITNSVTNADGTISQPWLPETSTSYRIAGFSSRGNVGIGIEGTSGRFKPDVIAPGTFTVSTRSTQWDTGSYFYQNPTNYDIQFFPGVIVNADSLWFNGFPIVPDNAIAVNITVSPNADSPNPFPTNPIYFAMIGSPFPPALVPTSIPNQVNIPPDQPPTLDDILNNETFYGFNYGVSNITLSPMSFDLTTTIVTTNSLDNHLLVLSNLDDTIGPYYRFESGTSMSAADVSGVLALMQDFFTNTLHQTPSPALLKAMLINGARPTGAYNLQVNNAINYEGWGMVNLPNSLPTNTPASYNGSGTAPSSIFIQDQSPTNALATGDTHTFAVTILTNMATLRVTLAWTDPPGDPIAAIKLVNSLELVVTNSDNPTNPVVYYGNDIPAGGTFNTPENATNSVSVDVINNVQSVILQLPLGTNYSIAVIGRRVNVNAVSAQTNSYAGPPNSPGIYAPNVVQDYALVVSSGNGNAPGSFTVADNGIVSNPTAGQNITFVTATNQPLLNQFVGANSPVLNTNTVSFNSNTAYGNAQDTLGTTNQWHFYVVTNNGVVNSNRIISAAPNAGFVTFLPPTLSVPRMGVFAGSQANATRPQADIDLYVTTDSNLLILSPLTFSNCINGTQIGLSVPAGVNGVFNGASLSRGGTEFVVDSNSTPGEVYYIGVKSEDQLASEYDFLPVFSNIPFSEMNSGNEIVHGVPVPVDIPDGTPANPGVNFVLGLALYPITVEAITATTAITHENFGDLYGTLTHTDSGTGLDTVDVLNNHDAWRSVGSPGLPQIFNYDETNVIVTGSPPNPISGPSDGPGSLKLFAGKDGTGVWRLTEVDDSLTQTGSVQNFTMVIQPHRPMTGGVTNTIPPHSFITDSVNVPAGATNLTICATNITTPPDTVNPVLMVIKFGSVPTLANADKGPVALVNGTPQPGNSLSVGPTDVPPIQPGVYWVGFTNQSDTAQTVFYIAKIPNPGAATTDFASTGSTTLLDDAVTYSDIWVATNLPIVSLNVGIEVQHARISDLVFHLISPDGTRVLLMENRGGTSTNGAGAAVIITNLVYVPSSGGATPKTNIINVGETSGTLPISWDFFSLPDRMTVYDTTNNFVLANLIFDTGLVSFTGQNNLAFTTASGCLTIIMNQFGNSESTTIWNYTAGGVFTNYYYLAFTENTNLTTTPIKFAPPPFVPMPRTNYYFQTNIVYTTNTFVVTNDLAISGFESAAASNYASPSVVSGWAVTGNQVSVVTDTLNAYQGSNFLALASGVISNTLPTVASNTYTLKFAYRGPGIVGWWRAENNTNDSVNGNNPTAVQGITFTNGEVGRAFHYDGSTSLITVPVSTSLAVSNLTLEAWIFPTDSSTARPIIDCGGPGQASTVQLWINTTGGNGVTAGALHAVIYNPSGGIEVDDASPVITVNQWNHLVLTVNTMTRTAVLYSNGVQAASGTAPNSVNPQSFANVNIGYRDAASPQLLAGRRFLGNLDEVSIYNRPLSASEIKAIYAKGILGKFDSFVFTTSASKSLAEVQVSIGTGTPTTITGNNTTWQIQTNTFTATQNGTPLVIIGVEPGMLLDSFTMTSNQVTAVTNVITNAVVTMNNLYYLPEQSLDAFTGKSAYGDWQLEIQDDRAGAGLTNSLVSWELQFVFANTNAVPAVLGGGIGQSNQFIPAGGIAWYKINVPAGATAATNILLFASAPVNVWFSTNVPPTTDTLFLPDGAYPGGTNGSVVLSTTNAPNPQPPPKIYDGQTYYLGVQNPNAFTVNYGIEVDFDHGNSTNSVLPALRFSSISASGSGTTLKWAASSTAQFQVQWKDDLTQPWTTDPTVITSGDGNFTFADDGSQTAPLGAMRFYRLVQISP